VPPAWFTTAQVSYEDHRGFVTSCQSLAGASGSEPIGQRLEDLRVGPHALRRSLDAAAQQHTALEVGHGAFLFRPLRHRKHHIGLGSGLGQEQVRHHQHVESVEPGAELRRCRR